MAENAQNNLDTILGRVIVDQGLATTDEVEACLQAKRQRNADNDPNQLTLGDLLVEKGLVTTAQLQRVKDKLEVHGQGTQIPGYKIKKKLGSGAMATVYLARQVSLDRLVAIKILPKKYSESEQFVERFYAEGKAAAKLNHANIVQAFDVGKAGEYHYFVMEYVEGRTVYDELTKFKRYEEADAVRIIIQIAEALDHAHKAGFIHRDVKPKNIMITNDNVAKLADMGLARAVSDREAAEQEKGKAYGTPYYISPEQIRGVTDVDFRADIYGLGATFYHMVTGQVPFDGPNPSAVMHMHLKESITPPDHINPKLSAGVSEIIEVCMAKDREKRYNSSADLLEDLRAVARGEPPMQARGKFDLSSLSQLESTGTAISPINPDLSDTMQQDAQGSLLESPMFWIAVSGWGVALLMMLILIINML